MIIIDSLYGGKQGQSFVIKASFGSVDDMGTAFKQGENYTSVWYGEYVLIDTKNKNDKDNGKIYRRGTNYSTALGGAIYVGQIVGPSSGTPYIALTSAQAVHNLKTNSEDAPYIAFPKGVNSDGSVVTTTTASESLVDLSFDQTNSGNIGLVPGKVTSNGTTTYNDNITYTWLNIRNDDADSDSWFYVGLTIPYLVQDIAVTTISPYKSASVVTTNKIGDTTHPFWQKATFSIPRGVKGDAIRGLRCIELDTSWLPDASEAKTIYNPSDVSYDTDGKASFATSTYEVTKNDLGKWIYIYELYVYDKSEAPSPKYIYLADKHDVKDIEVKDDGTIVFGYNDKTSETLSKKIKWVKSVALSAKGVLTFAMNDDSKKNYFLDYIKGAKLTKDGTLSWVHTSQDVNGVRTYDVEEKNAEKIKWVDSIDFPDIDQSSSVKYSSSLKESKSLKVKYNTETSAISVGENINYIADVVVRESDSHLLVLYTDPSHRLTLANPKSATENMTLVDKYGRSWTNYVPEGAYYTTDLDIFWQDFGAIKDTSGLLVGQKVTPTDLGLEKPDSGRYSSQDVIKGLNALYPQGLTNGKTKEKVVVFIDDTTTPATSVFYAYDYAHPYVEVEEGEETAEVDTTNYVGWFYFGTLGDVSSERDATLNDIKNTADGGLSFNVSAFSYVPQSAIPAYWTSTYSETN